MLDRASLGLVSLSNRYGEPRLKSACTIALGLGTSKYTPVRDMLAHGRDQAYSETAE
jgi:hypothetical protein